MFRALTFAILILFITVQCTVQKRLYNRGYSVSWNKRFREESKEREEPKEREESKEKETSLYENDSAEEDENVGVIKDSVITLVSVDESISDDGLEISDSDQPVLFDESEIKKPLADTVYINSVNVPSGVAAMAFLGGAALSEIAIYFTSMGFFALLGLAFLIVSFILAIISVVEFRRNRKLYLSNDFGLIALVIDSILLALAIAVFLVVLFVFVL